MTLAGVRTLIVCWIKDFTLTLNSETVQRAIPKTHTMSPCASLDTDDYLDGFDERRPKYFISNYGWMVDRIHVPVMEPLLRTSPCALVSRVYSVCTLFRDSTKCCYYYSCQDKVHMMRLACFTFKTLGVRHDTGPAGEEKNNWYYLAIVISVQHTLGSRRWAMLRIPAVLSATIIPIGTDPYRHWLDII
jgi:hypothetical protein